MAIGTITIGARVALPDCNLWRCSFLGDTSYPTGGTLLMKTALKAAIKTAAAAAVDANVRGPEDLTIVGIIGGDCGQWVPFYVPATDALKVLDGGHATRAEVTATTPLNGTTFNVTFITK